MEGKLLPIDKIFSKGFIRDKGRNKTPEYFADDVWNVRIKNGGITQRLGSQTLYQGDGSNPQFMESVLGNLYVGVDGDLCEVNTTTGEKTTIGAIGTTEPCNTIVYGRHLIILTGAGFPRVYDGTTLSQLTSTNIATDTNPQFGGKFAGFTVVNSQLDPNSILISRPIGLATQEYSYDRSGSGSESITFDSKVLGLIGTMNFLRIFTEKTIEYIGKDNLSTVGEIASLYTIPLGQGFELANSECLVGAGDIIMFMTKNKKIGAVRYKENITTPGIDIISDNDINSIDGWLQNHVHDNFYTTASAIFDKKNTLIKWYVRSNNSLYNDKAVIYDIQRDTRLKDDNMYVSDTAVIGDIIYNLSSLGTSVRIEDVADNDDNDPIYLYYKSSNITLGDPTQVKQVRGLLFSGQMNAQTKVSVNIYADGVKVFTDVIDGSRYSSPQGLGIGGHEVGGQPLGGNITRGELLFDFEKVVSSLRLRTTGKKFVLEVISNELGQDVLLDFFGIFVRAKTRRRVSDK